MEQVMGAGFFSDGIDREAQQELIGRNKVLYDKLKTEYPLRPGQNENYYFVTYSMEATKNRLLAMFQKNLALRVIYQEPGLIVIIYEIELKDLIPLIQAQSEIIAVLRVSGDTLNIRVKFAETKTEIIAFLAEKQELWQVQFLKNDGLEIEFQFLSEPERVQEMMIFLRKLLN